MVFPFRTIVVRASLSCFRPLGTPVLECKTPNIQQQVKFQILARTFGRILCTIRLLSTFKTSRNAQEGSVMRRRSILLPVLLGLLFTIGSAAGQKGKPWTQWNQRDAEKILNDSGWGQTQTAMSTSEMTFSTASRDISGKGAVNEASGVNFRIRFLSAKPIRQAFLRLLQLDPKVAPEQVAQVQRFVDTKYDNVVVIAVSYDQDGLPKDGRFTAPVFQAFSSGITSTLQNNVYLDLKGGKRIFLQEYIPPSSDGLGAKFVFPRTSDGKPLLEAKSGDIRFYAEFPRLSGNNQQVRLTMRFKVSDMLYDGIIEY